jgi:pyruvate formate lyase activating enzyme
LAARPRGNIGIAFTYNEPLVGYEYVRDTATLAQREGLKTVLVSNGYANPAIIAEVGACIDAANIDLKGFSQDFYDFVGAPQGLRVVKRTIEYLASHCHLEVTNLLVPGINSSCEEVAELARWLASIDPGIPLHITRYHPAHQLCHLPATPTPSGAGGRGSSAEASAPCLCG